MGNYGPIHVDVVVVTDAQELLTYELHVVVGDDDIRNPKVMSDVSEEQDGLFGADAADGSSLDPLGELVDDYK
jgi:hypothetical protein